MKCIDSLFNGLDFHLLINKEISSNNAITIETTCERDIFIKSFHTSLEFADDSSVVTVVFLRKYILIKVEIIFFEIFGKTSMKISDFHTFNIFSIHPIEFHWIKHSPRFVNISDFKFGYHFIHCHNLFILFWVPSK